MYCERKLETVLCLVSSLVRDLGLYVRNRDPHGAQAALGGSILPEVPSDGTRA